MEKTILYAFDFDYTIVNVNSDTQIAKLLPNPLPKEIKEFYDGSNWTEYVNKVLEYLYASGVTIEKIEEFVSNLPPSPGKNYYLSETNNFIYRICLIDIEFFNINRND